MNIRLAPFPTLLVISLLAARVAAQSQYSVNALGYVDLNLVAGSNLVANPFNAGDNSVSNLFRGLPDGAVFQPWDRANARFGPSNVYHAATGWTDPAAKLLLPAGAFLWLPSSRQISFAGDVSWPLPGGCYQYQQIDVSMMPPAACGFCNPNPCPMVPDNTVLSRWNPGFQDWESFYYFSQLGGWFTEEFDPVEMPLAFGEAGLFQFAESFSARFPFTTGTSGPVRLTAWGRVESDLTFRVPGNTNVGYTLLRATNPAGTWSVFSNGVANASNGQIVLRAPIGTNREAFYKLGAMAPPAFLFNASRSNNQFRFQFFSVAGVLYTVQRAAALDTGTWQTVGNVTGNGALQTFTDTAATSATGYYRLQF